MIEGKNEEKKKAIKERETDTSDNHGDRERRTRAVIELGNQPAPPCCPHARHPPVGNSARCSRDVTLREERDVTAARHPVARMSAAVRPLPSPPSFLLFPQPGITLFLPSARVLRTQDTRRPGQQGRQLNDSRAAIVQNHTLASQGDFSLP
ncbi:hypothetical protein C0Q70_07137 [Pomacea canaliculata]|uniref:Uncharacterized protein n=1 Tax=Pomacea canaliculata TaxID=400727 RepID=A0A2T7PE78_POMCA|nr:hypothetical protein C0Q70_07137 [Pomacea canaliculata]